MPGIASKQALLAVSQHRDVAYTNIAHTDIQDRRSRQRVPCGREGHLHDYVPFYFAPRSPMLCAIHHGRVAGYTGSQSDVVYLISSVEHVVAAGLPFVFTDGHAVIFLSNFYADVARLDRIDWNLMESRYWNDTEDDPDRKRRRQAEFLVFHSFPLNLITEVSVINQSAVNRIRALLDGSRVNIPVTTRPNWYF